MGLFDSRKSAPVETLAAPSANPVPPMEDLLRLVLEEGASDLHLSVGTPPALRRHGRLVKLNTRPLTPEDTEKLARAITSDANFARVNEQGTVDFGFSFRDKDRFRVSVYRQRGCIAVALRIIPKRMLSLEEIGLPPAVRSLLETPRGLILVAGPTGSGKTTTLASILDAINTTRDSHIITIEDPLEYVHDHKLGIINQREVGVDVSSVAALIRDNKTFRITNDILTGSKYGMISLEASLVEHYLAGLISYEQVLTKAQDQQAAIQLIGGQKPRKR